jgi:benzoyl-CoA reductase/2-hydroxyglutaryl-CoA dehydratase subunit BcrC/BadD/HgdB
MGTKVDLIRNLSEKVEAIAGIFKGGPAGEFPDRAVAIQLLSDYYKKVYQEKEEGRPLAWINYAVAPELFWGLGITPVVIDAISGMAAENPETAMPYIDKAEEQIPDYICSVNKIFLGAVLSGDVPMPDMIVVPSHPCDSNLATYPVIAERFGFPYFCMDAPYFRDERGLDHFTKQIADLLLFLEERAGRKLPYEELRSVVEHSNRTHEYLLKISELAQSVPSPFSSMDMLMDYGLVLSLAGTPELADYLEMKYEVVKERMARAEKRQTDEKLRLVWIYGAPVFDYGLFFHLEQTYGAFSVGNMNNNFIMNPVEDLSSTESILRGLAWKVINLPMGRECGGPWENYVGAMIDLCGRYKADAAVFAGHVACKANWPIMKLVKDRIRDDLGIPTMLFELDLMDPRVTSMDSIKQRFHEFFTVHFPEVIGPDTTQ